MKNTLTAGAALLLTTSMVQAVGLDRSGQPIGIIFEEGGASGSYAELSYGYVSPDVDGTDLPAFGGLSSGNATDDFDILGLGVKTELNDQWSVALIIDEPYGVDIDYPDDGSVAFGGTQAFVDSYALTGLVRYKFDDNFSVHGGVRAQSIEADITLSGLAFGALNGYDVELDRDTGVGYTIGAAYERPDIALRVAVTYISEIDHEFETTDTLGSTADTDVTTPQAVNLDFQTGIAPDTLLFGSVRWAEYSNTIVTPENFPAGSLTDIEDNFGYTLGVGRRFTDAFSASITLGFEEEEDDDLVSPLAPTNGNYSIAVGGQYEINDFVLSGGVRYVVVGDAEPETGTPDEARADFDNNDAIAVGFQIGYNF